MSVGELLGGVELLNKSIKDRRKRKADAESAESQRQVADLYLSTPEGRTAKGQVAGSLLGTGQLKGADLLKEGFADNPMQFMMTVGRDALMTGDPKLKQAYSATMRGLKDFYFLESFSKAAGKRAGAPKQGGGAGGLSKKDLDLVDSKRTVDLGVVWGAIKSSTEDGFVTIKANPNAGILQDVKIDLHQSVPAQLNALRKRDLSVESGLIDKVGDFFSGEVTIDASKADAADEYLRNAIVDKVRPAIEQGVLASFPALGKEGASGYLKREVDEILSSGAMTGFYDYSIDSSKKGVEKGKQYQPDKIPKFIYREDEVIPGDSAYVVGVDKSGNKAFGKVKVSGPSVSKAELEAIKSAGADDKIIQAYVDGTEEQRKEFLKANGIKVKGFGAARK